MPNKFGTRNVSRKGDPCTYIVGLLPPSDFPSSFLNPYFFLVFSVITFKLVHKCTFQ